jgi:UDP-GlcNAc:undecaprenyl-phosphate GlcNAc-1-phosphate transferase
MLEFYIFFFLIINFLIIFNLERLVRIVNIYDIPDKKRKIHKHKVPLIGGVLLIVNIIFYFLFFVSHIKLNLNELLFFTCFLVFIVGLLDDKYDLSPLIKFVSLGLIFSSLIYFDKDILIKHLYLEQIGLKIYLSYFSFPFTLLCFLLFLNALNMFDGINLQSLTYSIFVLSVLFFKSNNIFIAAILIVVFFISYLNFKNKIYLGDSGVYILSFLISYFVIKFHNNNYLIKPDEIFILMSIPGIDMLRLFIQRLLNKNNPFKADRNHLHHMLLKKFGYKKTIIFLNIFFITPYILFFHIQSLAVVFITFLIYFFILFFIKKNQKII